MTKTDIAVIGGGLSGTAMALALSRAGLTTALCQRQGSTAPEIGEHLPPEGVAALRALGAEDLLASPAHRPSPGVVSIWGAQDAARRSYFGTPGGGTGWHLDRAVFARDLRTLAGGKNVQACDWQGRLQITGGPGAWQLTDEAGRLQEAGFLVDATGRSAWLARQMGAKVRRGPPLMALAGLGMSSIVPDASLRLESHEAGWSYAAPLSQDRAVVVVLGDADLLPKGQIARQDHWAKTLSRSAVMSDLLRAPEDAAFLSTAAWSQSTDPPAGPGWCATGDAALAYDPISSGGMTKALRDATWFADQCMQSEQSPDPAGIAVQRTAQLEAYEADLTRAYISETRFSSAPFWARRQGL